MPLTIICTRLLSPWWNRSTPPWFSTSASDRVSVLLPVPVRSMTSMALSLPAALVRSSTCEAPTSFSVSMPLPPWMAAVAWLK
ncbi:hypothetical protein D9M68_909680 [compost metagenome]